MRVKSVFRNADKLLHRKIKVEGWLERIPAKDGRGHISAIANHDIGTNVKYLLLPKYIRYRDRVKPIAEPHEQFLKLFDDDTYPLSREEANFHLNACIDIETKSVEHLHVFYEIGLIEKFAEAYRKFTWDDSIETVDDILSAALPMPISGRYPGYVIGVLDNMEAEPEHLILKHITEAAFEHPDYTFRTYKNAADLEQVKLGNTSAVTVVDILTTPENYLHQTVLIKGVVGYDGSHYVMPHGLYYLWEEHKRWRMLIEDEVFQSKYSTDNLEAAFGAPPYLGAAIQVVGKVIESQYGGLGLTDIEAAVTNDNGGRYIWKL